MTTHAPEPDTTLDGWRCECGKDWPCPDDDRLSRITRLPRFGVVDGVLVAHHRGTVVRLDDVLAALPDPEHRRSER